MYIDCNNNNDSNANAAADADDEDDKKKKNFFLPPPHPSAISLNIKRARICVSEVHWKYLKHNLLLTYQ